MKTREKNHALFLVEKRSGDLGIASTPLTPPLRERRARRTFLLLLLALGLFLLLTILLAVGIGSTPISPAQVFSLVVEHVSGTTIAPQNAIQDAIIWQIRLPRVLLGAIVGAGLGVVGACIQALVRNPLADPFLLGVSSGASLGAVVVIILGISIFGIYTLSVGAFVGSLLALLFVFILSHYAGRIAPLRLILAGVAISYVFSGVSSFLIFQANRDAASTALFWLLGSLGSASWDILPLPAVVLCVGMALLLLQSRALNALLMGEESAISLGINVRVLRRYLLVLTALLTGVIVAVSGGIGFVGLMIPHGMRLFVGAEHRRLLPLTALAGAIFLIWADTLSRIAVAPSELPLGVVTSLIGAPFFLWLMQRKNQKPGGGA